jgi:hypothetical protein
VMASQAWLLLGHEQLLFVRFGMLSHKIKQWVKK